jgi:hypothetical protein
MLAVCIIVLTGDHVRHPNQFPETISVRVPAEIGEGLRTEAAQRGVDVSDVARELLAAGIERKTTPDPGAGAE